MRLIAPRAVASGIAASFYQSDDSVLAMQREAKQVARVGAGARG